MNCDECREMLVEYSLGELPPEEMLRVDLHLAGPCSSCQLELAEISQAFHSVGSALPPLQPPSRVKSELMARIREVSSPAILRTLPTASATPRWRQLLPYAAAVAVAMFLGATAANYWQGNRTTQAEQREYNRRMDVGRRLFQSPQIRLATFHSLHPTVGHSDPPAYIVSDHLTRQWHIYAFDLKPPTAGHALQLWFFTTDSKWIKAEPLRLQEDGVSTSLFLVPPQVTIRRAIISDEPDSDFEEPKGTILLSAELPLDSQ